MYALNCWENKIQIDQTHIGRPVKVTLPARFDFIGGWTDTPPYFFDNRACVLNSTLELAGSGNFPELNKRIAVQVSYSRVMVIEENKQILRKLDDNPIIKQCFDFLHLENPKISLSVENWIPKGSGLGGSSLFAALILSALWSYYKGIDYVRNHLNELVNNVLLIEQQSGSGGGWQDQIGGILPGVKFIEVNPETKCSYSISYLNGEIEKLNKISLIVDSRIQRKAANILHSIRQKYVERDPETINVLKTIALNAKLGFNLLLKGDVYSFAQLLSESWQMVNSVEHGAIDQCDMIKKLCGKDLAGLKIGGAGGGGFILAIFQNEEKKHYYADIIHKHFRNCGIYKPVFGGRGLSLHQENVTRSKQNQIYEAGNINFLKCNHH